MSMNITLRATIVLAICTTAYSAFAADHFWSCTTPVGVQYADATKCDKGDSATKRMKIDQAASLQEPMTQTNQQVLTAVCPVNPADCSLQDYGAQETSHRTQAIIQFMHKKQCEFAHRFPQRCAGRN
jgi:hypothetical protein